MEVILYRKSLTTGKIEKRIQIDGFIMGYDNTGRFCRCAKGLDERSVKFMIENNVRCKTSGFLWSLREIKE